MHRRFAQTAWTCRTAPAGLVLCDPEPRRAAELIAALEPNLPVVHESRLEALEHRCRRQAPAAAAVPLHWPTPPEADTQSAEAAKAPLLRFLQSYGRPLERMVAEGTFRADLYQRLNVFQIGIPPLRERPEDIAVQARHFLKIHQKDRSEPVPDFDPRAGGPSGAAVGRQQPAAGEPGPRDPRHKDGATPVRMEDLPHWVVQILAQLLPAAPASAPGDAPAATGCRPRRSLTQAVEEYECRLLQAALRQNGGNRTRTAAELGLSTRSIFNKIQKYRLG